MIKNELTCEEVLEIVSNRLGIDIRKKTNERFYSDARSIYYYLCYKYAVDSSNVKYVGGLVNTHHSTVIASLKDFTESLEFNKFLQRNYTKVWKVFEQVLETKDLSYLELIKEVDSLSEVKLKRRVKDLMIRNRKKEKELQSLKNYREAIKQLNKQ